jgi:Acetyltransferase (GNAT) family
MHVAQRLRLRDVAADVEEVRARVRDRGGTRVLWEVADAAEPGDLVERLLGLGAAPAGDRDPEAVVMGATGPPDEVASPFEVVAVEAIPDYRAFVTVTFTVFGAEEHLPDELERIDRDGLAKLADKRFVRYLARLDGRPVAAASATFAPAGAILHGGSTLPEARGRGAYRALVAARRQEALARGTPAVVTRAGAESRPILLRLGFGELGRLRTLEDDLRG